MSEHPASAELHGEAPEGGASSVIEADDGIKLRFAHWPAEGEMRGAILLAQGRTEYIEKAYEWIEKFRSRGLHVAAFDFRGQGLSERLLPNRRRGYVEDFAQFQLDYDAAYRAFREIVGDAVPMVVCGHSMGGLATTRFLSRRQTDLKGAILSAPMFGLALPPPVSWLAFLMSKAATATGFGARYVQGCDDRSGPDRGFEGNVLTHDGERFARHAAMWDRYPDLILGGTTHQWLSAGFDEMRGVAALPKGWLSIPALVLSAEEDTVVSNKAIAKFVRTNPFAERVRLAGSRHEPLMEVEAVQAMVWPAIDTYLDRVLPQSPVGN